MTRLLPAALALLCSALPQAAAADNPYLSDPARPGGKLHYRPTPAMDYVPAYYMPIIHPPVPGYRPTESYAGPDVRVTVVAYDGRFEPSTVRVAPGGIVSWVNYGRGMHTVTPPDGSWGVGGLPPGTEYAVTFDRPGTYRYKCNNHKGMEGTVVVEREGRGSGR